MEIRPIKTEADYKNALANIERLWGAEVNTPEGDTLDVLLTLVETYEPPPPHRVITSSHYTLVDPARP